LTLSERAPCTLPDLNHTVIDERLDFLGGLSRSAREAANLGSHHYEPSTLLAGTGGFYSRMT
jgi:hypothetical protein